ncbi:formimidoylglutamate deiminase [Phaeobacter gallaeciensis]|uniref:formimidoylglutamate deiminase n=1 Tax=Phaeobacter gallaeciensis TaxID=60890 RepID=UPI00237F559D|nr:formimidoylglutamate deiminase [Phaeobacter gallaeciensis]MDE4193276.1 formimidoylglutamate deiminase [Phaeobacter gallaeciensis]MDE4198416.1 formimidoylglutamate deiminase [Phaeobacter gallaeciensis]MDE4202561.1 formimidoylglutamate deiminase [Phaeobacter gallaeciensis]MDE4206143.1 formimidoylglutamate deiminase [Phaeobacter gallaeciensis]MDE4214510.1 formimidoylglutamate deiminase [Phaeobacter gallaeciensis]
MQTIFARQARTPSGWVQNVRLRIENGAIAKITANAAPGDGDTCVDTLLPGLANLHSHSFQRAMAGMSEYRAAGQDSFWTWRQLMYRFLDHLSPEQYQAIAALTFMEMLEAGYTAVGEFHYVHHQPGGALYDDPAELSNRVFAAADETGIGLTHLPVLYSYGGAGQQPLTGGQLRFGNSVDGFADLVAQVRRNADRDLPADTHVGIAPHSLRATSPEDLAEALKIQDGAPVHIHIAEQPAEVKDIQDWLGSRPVEWLLNNAPVGKDWCLIHATHMTEAETRTMATSGAVAGLCPITEANLGDGPFNGAEYLAHGGRFGIGSDSNIRIALPEELRQLEYSQRLRDLARNVMTPGPGSVGDTLYLGAARGGAQALGRAAGQIETGALADLIAVDTSLPALCALTPEQLLDGLCFAAGDGAVTDVWSAGRHQVKQGRHVGREQILAAFRDTVQSLRAAL